MNYVIGYDYVVPITEDELMALFSQIIPHQTHFPETGLYLATAHLRSFISEQA